MAALLAAGADGVRINMSHGTHEEKEQDISMARAAAARMNRPLAVLIDLSGPKIRTRTLKNHQPVKLEANQQFIITTREIEGDNAQVATNYQGMPSDVHVGARILLDDGAIVGRFDDVRADAQRRHRRGTFQENVEIRRDGARRRRTAAAFHQHDRGRPVAVTVEQRADDAAVEDVIERGVMRLRRPVANEFVPLAEAADAQAFVIGRPAAEAAVLRRVRFLDAFSGHVADCIPGVETVLNHKDTKDTKRISQCPLCL